MQSVIAQESRDRKYRQAAVIWIPFLSLWFAAVGVEDKKVVWLWKRVGVEVGSDKSRWRRVTLKVRAGSAGTAVLVGRRETEEKLV